jgi:hypothetical protein
MVDHARAEIRTWSLRAVNPALEPSNILVARLEAKQRALGPMLEWPHRLNLDLNLQIHLQRLRDLMPEKKTREATHVSLPPLML